MPDYDTRPAPEVPKNGIIDIATARNGVVVSGPGLASLANFAYMNRARRRQVFYSKHAGIASSFASGITHRTRFIGGQAGHVNGGGVWCTVVYSDSGTVGNAGFATFNVNGVSALSDFPDPANSGTAAAGPKDFRTRTFRLTNAVQDDNAVDWSVDANSAINGVIIYGCSMSSGSLAANAFRTDGYKVGAPIVGSTLGDGYFRDLLANSWTMFQLQGTHHIHWSGTAARTGPTFANVLDASTAGYSSTAPGFWVIPQGQQSLSRTTVDVVCWCYASSTGTTGRVRFTNSAGTIATITGIGAGAYYTATATLDATLTTSDLVIVECSEATGGQTVTVTGAGIYDYFT